MKKENVKNILKYINAYSSDDAFRKYANKANVGERAKVGDQDAVIGKTPAYKKKDGDEGYVDSDGNILSGPLVPEGDTKGAPVLPGFGGKGSPPNPEIKHLQEAIKNFVNTVLTYKQATKQFDAKGKPVIDPVTRQQKLNKDPKENFNDFIIEQYGVGGNAFKEIGTEFTPNPKLTAVDQKQPTELIQFKNAMDSIRRMGNSKNEFEVDGRWDFRTQNAIRCIYVLAEALVRLTEDLYPGQVTSFTRKDLQEFRTSDPFLNIGYNEFDRVKIQPGNPQKLLAIAPKLEVIINKLTTFYREYQQKVITSAIFKPYLKEQYDLMEFKPGGDDPGEIPDDLVEDERQVDSPTSNLYLLNVALPTPATAQNPAGGTTTVKYLPLSYLKDLEGLKKLATTLGYPPNYVNNYNILSRLLKNIKSHLSANPVQATQPAQYPTNNAQPSPDIVRQVVQNYSPGTVTPFFSVRGPL